MVKWMRRSWLGLALLAAGCSDSQDEGLVQQQARLERFETCEALETYVKDTAVQQMRSSLESMKPSRQGSGGGWGIGMPEATTGAPAADSGGRGGSAPTDYTGTNNQVQGVDEADFVKTDGTRLFVLSGQRLYALRSWPAESLRTESSLTIEGWPREMYLEGNQVVVFSGVYTDYGTGGTYSGGAVADVARCAPGGYCGGSNTTKVTVVDVTDMAAPRVVDELFLQGAYDTARKVGGSVRMVMNDSVYWPPQVRWWPEYSPGIYEDHARLERAIDELMVSNEQLIRAWPLEKWLPQGWRPRADGTREPLAYDCGDFHRTNGPTQLGFVTVASLELGGAAEAARVSPHFTRLVAAPGVVYGSQESLYLASHHWWWWPRPGQQQYTYLHKLDIRQPGRARYVASTTVQGHLLNQFSMDEYQGVLRAAVTLARRVEDGANPWWGRLETTNRVVTLGERGDRLEVLGQSEELAPGERIFSARFIGPKGYVVTFRQVDPLFTFDLSDPTQPRKVGELKIPGFSTYIHPLEGDWLLTLGVHVPENGDWRQRALKLSMFDVRDMAQPREAFTYLVGTAYGWSEAQHEHKAFNFFPARGLLAIPFADWHYDSYDPWRGFVSDLRLFRVDTTTGFTPVGSVSLADVYQSSGVPPWSWYGAPQVRRSVMADDYVYAISDAGVRVARSDTPHVPLATAVFPPPSTH